MFDQIKNWQNFGFVNKLILKLFRLQKNLQKMIKRLSDKNEAYNMKV